jgi:ADP-ribosylglycohydrolase
MAGHFVRWFKEGYWSARGTAFDIGHTTQVAIQRLDEGVPPEKAGPDREASNGNGALMRISPLAFWFDRQTIPERFRLVRRAASVTHGHIRSAMACFYYVEFARLLLAGMDKFAAYRQLQDEMRLSLPVLVGDPAEIALLGRLMSGALADQPEGRIRGSGYVLHTLEASLWCLLTTNTYRDAVLRAVNLGEDTDTTAAVTGALAGICYGAGQIPGEWLDQLARREDIEDLARRFATALPGQP